VETALASPISRPLGFVSSRSATGCWSKRTRSCAEQRHIWLFASECGWGRHAGEAV